MQKRIELLEELVEHYHDYVTGDILSWSETYMDKWEAKRLSLDLKLASLPKEQSDVVTRQYPAKCSACNGTGSDFSRIDMMNTSSVCIVCKGKGVITVTEQFPSQTKEQSVSDADIEKWADRTTDNNRAMSFGKEVGAKAHRDGLIKK